MWRAFRLTVLLTTLVLVAGVALLDRARTTSWQHTVWVGAFPVNADGSAAAADYIAALRQRELAPVAEFINREAHAHGVLIDEPVNLRLYAPLAAPPPTLPPDAGPFGRAWWSLQLRQFRWRTLHGIAQAPPQIALFLLYHDPARAAVLPDSVGLQRGLMGVVHLFAQRDQAAQNAIVTAHELLHTFGATDKYAPDSDAPRYPDGYAEPGLQPRYPQRRAEIMAGRIPLDETMQVMPESLGQVVVGPATAREIGWSAPP